MKIKSLKARTSLGIQFIQPAMPVQMFSQRVLLFIFPLLINWAIIAANRDFHESSLERKMENMAEVVKEMKGVSAESSMRINDHFVSTLNTESFTIIQL